MSLNNEINKLNRIRSETSSHEVEELLKNLVKSLEIIEKTLNDHEARLLEFE